ncbi:protein ALTERED PHOSPHATE STARVATION RESPONSE 1-like [Macadamia integrifolia]|uniref:protein ALTERED PHOSPHATE STARVATION RESPONSE 1-like n=1 Tax=Macadamia integrifolia TaxID=60698 RepID=UPI001C4F3AD9|nr:protein ALTERED PHOSPHATE STARVATION RESPONSE 1-like [Macadamia integrifolia]XP_042513171.1 protein ALTERED PHOSPHATE STARVATION RESPONSE 1-like [Macadamia integrifolia]
MGCSSSRSDRNEALRLCKERKKFIEQAIDSRYALAAAHLCYVQSFRNIGTALRRFAEAEVLTESSLSNSATELDKTPSHSSYPSPSPSHIAETLDSPLHNESPISSPLPNFSYMRLGGTAAVTVSIDSSLDGFVEDEFLNFPPPPPPPPPGAGFSWDYFDPADETERFRFYGGKGFDRNMSELRQFREEVVPFIDGAGEQLEKTDPNWNGEILTRSERRPATSGDSAARSGSKASSQLVMPNADSFSDITSEAQPVDDGKLLQSSLNCKGLAEALVGNVVLEQSNSGKERTELEKELSADREDPSEFITHRAKDFLSSMKDIEHRFFRASESGKEVSRMLEANKIRLNCTQTKGSSPNSVLVSACDLVCCQRQNTLLTDDTPQHTTKLIAWNRSTSFQSSSSRNRLATASKDEIDDSGSEFIEEFCMISGSHSSTLDRLYAWERKLYDEVKAGESIKKVYDQKCDQLRHQFARDLSPRVVDKTRAVVKDLHSRITVAIHAVDSIAKRIEKLRDEELQPQLVELIQGLIRMWKAMLACHHAQYITISLAYHSKSSTSGPGQGDSHRQVLAHLQHEIECFGSSFRDWIEAHRSYVEALNGWLQYCILPPKERSKGSRVFCPRRALAPPIFVLCLDWSAGIRALPSGELTDAIKALASDVSKSMEQQAEDQQKKQGSPDSDDGGGSENRENERHENTSNLGSIHSGLIKAFDRLTKFAEASLKMYEDIRQGSEAARIAYTSCRTTSL